MIKIDFESRLPIFEQIVKRIKELIFTDLIKEEDKLPSIKELSNILHINPNHIKRAYEVLKEELIIDELLNEEYFVRKNSKDIAIKDKEKIIIDHVDKLILEGHKLKYSMDEIKEIIEKVFNTMGVDKC